MVFFIDAAADDDLRTHILNLATRPSQRYFPRAIFYKALLRRLSPTECPFLIYLLVYLFVAIWWAPLSWGNVGCGWMWYACEFSPPPPPPPVPDEQAGWFSSYKFPPSPPMPPQAPPNPPPPPSLLHLCGDTTVMQPLSLLILFANVKKVFTVGLFGDQALLRPKTPGPCTPYIKMLAEAGALLFLAMSINTLIKDVVDIFDFAAIEGAWGAFFICLPFTVATSANLPALLATMSFAMHPDDAEEDMSVTKLVYATLLLVTYGAMWPMLVGWSVLAVLQSALVSNDVNPTDGELDIGSWLTTTFYPYLMLPAVCGAGYFLMTVTVGATLSIVQAKDGAQRIRYSTLSLWKMLFALAVVLPPIIQTFVISGLRVGLNEKTPVWTTVTERSYGSFLANVAQTMSDSTVSMSEATDKLWMMI